MVRLGTGRQWVKVDGAVLRGKSAVLAESYEKVDMRSLALVCAKSSRGIARSNLGTSTFRPFNPLLHF